MRTIQQFSEMLAALLFDANTAGEEVTYKELDKLSSSFTGMGLDTLSSISGPQLIALFSIAGDLDVNKCYASARLIHQLAEQDSDEDEKLKLKAKSLDLLIEVREQLGEYLNDEHQALTEELEVATV